MAGAAAAATVVPLAAAAPIAAAPTAVAAAPIPPGVRGAYMLRPIATRPLALAPGATAAAGGSGDGFAGFAAVVFGGAATIVVVAAIVGSYIGGRFDAGAPPPSVPAPAPAPVAESAPAAIPDGAGVVSEVIEGRPKVSVYFAVGRNDIAPDFTAAVAPVKAWLDANPTDRAQAVAAELNAQGVAADRIDLAKPADASDGTVDLAGARRVEITVTGG